MQAFGFWGIPSLQLYLFNPVCEGRCIYAILSIQGSLLRTSLSLLPLDSSTEVEDVMGGFPYHGAKLSHDRVSAPSLVPPLKHYVTKT